MHKERKNMGMTYVYIIENSPRKVREAVDGELDATASSKGDESQMLREVKQ